MCHTLKKSETPLIASNLLLFRSEVFSVSEMNEWQVKIKALLGLTPQGLICAFILPTLTSKHRQSFAISNMIRSSL